VQQQLNKMYIYKTNHSKMLSFYANDLAINAKESHTVAGFLKIEY